MCSFSVTKANTLCLQSNAAVLVTVRAKRRAGVDSWETKRTASEDPPHAADGDSSSTLGEVGAGLLR